MTTHKHPKRGTTRATLDDLHRLGASIEAKVEAILEELRDLHEAGRERHVSTFLWDEDQ